MLWNSEDDGKVETKTPWIIGVFMVAVLALGTFMNFGSNLHLSSDTEVSARAKTVAE